MYDRLTTSTTAILLFNYSEKQKASLRKLVPGISSKKVEALITQLNLRARRLSRKSKLPFFQFDADTKSSFETQLYTAYQELFDQGYSRVIGITNDCPGLNEKDLQDACNSLQKNDLVLGPAKDGGLYLLGIRRATFSKKEFLGLQWQSDQLYAEINTLSESKMLCSEKLSVKSDMDTVAEFKTAFNSNFQYLVNFKSQLFSYCKRRFRLHQLTELNISSLNFSLRAPPAW